MTRPARLPIRLRLSVVFGVAMAVVLGALSAFVYGLTGAYLLNTVDTGLRSRAELLVSDLQQRGPPRVNVQPALVESSEAFAQIAGSSGQMLRSTATISRWRLLSPAAVRSLRRPAFHDQVIPVVDGTTRVLAVPAVTRQGRYVVMVGVSLQDRQDQLTQLGETLAIAGSAALCLISAGAWLALAGALRPVERMRRQAAAISASGPGRRLSAPTGRDEIALLGATLNQMLDRIEESVDRERQLVDRASHELRTPLAIQRIGLDLALSGPQTVAELAGALREVSVQNTHLTRLTEDLVVLSRARGGVLPVQLARTSLPELLDATSRSTS